MKIKNFLKGTSNKIMDMEIKANRTFAVFRWLVFLTLLVLVSITPANEPPNLTRIKKQLIKYHDSGEYYQAISNVIKEAMYYLQFRINQNNRSKHPKKLAIVLAIDETCLSNYADLVHLGFGGTYQEIKSLEAEGHDPAISYTLTLYNYAKEHGVNIFLVTGRNQYERESTIKNLKTVGFKGWSGLLMEENDYCSSSAIPFKSAQRKSIVMQGYDIVLNIGSQKSDLEGGYADMAFKLPNPFYQTT